MNLELDGARVLAPGGSALLLALALGFALPARANVPPPPPDPCLNEQEGASCKPYDDPAGTCRWISNDERNAMELPGRPRCEDRGSLGMRCLMCVSPFFEGGDTRLKRLESFIAGGDFAHAERLARYLYDRSKKCDPELARLLNRFGRAGTEPGSARADSRYSSFHGMAVSCDPRFYEGYLDIARANARHADKGRSLTAAFDALLQLSRALLAFDASMGQWEAFEKTIAADEALEPVRGDKRYAVVRERFALGKRAVAAQGLPFTYCKPEPAEWIRIGGSLRESGRYDRSCLPAVGEARCPSFFLKLRAAKPPPGLERCTAIINY